jgi:hypothetical protein
VVIHLAVEKLHADGHAVIFCNFLYAVEPRNCVLCSLIVGHSLGQGYFYYFDGMDSVPRDDLLKLEAEMRAIVARGDMAFLPGTDGKGRVLLAGEDVVPVHAAEIGDLTPGGGTAGVACRVAAAQLTPVQAHPDKRVRAAPAPPG